jgi:penicillin-binding protein 1A
MQELRHISVEEAEQIKAEPLPVPGPEREPQGSDYFTEHVKQLLLADERLGATAQERIQAVFKGGLAIHTTLDPHLQSTAEAKLAQIIPDSEGKFTAALVSVEPQTGAVRALVGGRGFDKSKFNIVTQGGRQTGSSFKVFTLIAALEAGYIPADTILGTAPCVIPNPGSVDPIWEPKNVEGDGGGIMSLTEATVSSVNCAYARLIKIVGAQKVVELAQRMGITSPLAPNLSLTLGTSDVTPLDMASAYATLAADGERHDPYFIERVDGRDGKVLFRSQPKVERAISTQNARIANQVLTQVVSRGTGTAAALSRWPVGGKTGSTDNNTNAWFVGYTAELSTAVWMGSPREYIEMDNVGGIRVYGGTYPAMVWGAYMREVVGDRPAVRFPVPEALTTRAPRFLEMPGERAVIQQDRTFSGGTGSGSRSSSGASSAADDDDTGQSSGGNQGGQGNQGGGSAITLPSQGGSQGGGGGPATTVFRGGGNDDDDDDDTPRTSRTSRPPRPRDLTTLPAEE